MYKMTDIKEGLRIGIRNDGMFDLEFTSGMEGDPDVQSLILAPDDAQAISEYIQEKL